MNLDSSPLEDTSEVSNQPFMVETVKDKQLSESFSRKVDTQETPLSLDDGIVSQGKRWREVTIEEIAEKVVMGPFGSSIKVETFVPDGVPIINGKHLHRMRVDDGPGFNFISLDHASRLSNANVWRGDVVFTHRGTIGQAAYIPMDSNYKRYVISQSQFYVRCDPEKALPEFVAMYFRSPEGQHKLLANASQVGVPSIAQPVSYLRTIPIPLPTLPEQRAIAHILGTLDDKIELNRRMNQTLEEMARVIFKDWFIDFGPTRAKMEGRWRRGESLLGLPAHLYDFFPDRLVPSELGEIPEGWEVLPLPEVIDYKEGPGIRHWQYTNSSEGIRFINIRCIQDGDIVLSTANRINAEEANGKYAHFHLRESDIIVSASGTLGRSAVVRASHLPLMLNTSVIRFRPVEGATTFSYLHGYLKSRIFLDELEMSASGSVQKNFGPMHLRDMRLLRPAYSCLKRYEEIAGLMLNKVIANRDENDALVAQRDVLLPKLVSGELRLEMSQLKYSD